MRKSLALVTAAVGLVLCASTFARDRGLEPPPRFAPQAHDRGLVQVQNPVDGTTWSAWAYRNGAEFDVAVSVADATGVWSEPGFVGLDDGSDQIDPALTVDGWGTVYLGFIDRAAGVIVLTALRHGAEAWSTPVAVTDPTINARSPSLAVVGDRLVVAYRTGAEVRIADLPLLPQASASSPPNQSYGINDGPDPTGIVDDSETDGRNGGSDPPPLHLPRDEPED